MVWWTFCKAPSFTSGVALVSFLLLDLSLFVNDSVINISECLDLCFTDLFLQEYEF